METSALRVVIVDDHAIFRSGLRALLETEPGFAVVGEASNGREAVRLAQSAAPDVVVMDVRLPDLNGIDTTRQILGLRPDVKVIGLSSNTDERSVLEMMRAGAAGYVAKSSAYEELVAAVRSVIKNRVYYSPRVMKSVARETGGLAHTTDTAFSRLSPREREVLQLIAEGKSTKEVAARLGVSVKTAETHRRNLMEKLQVDSVAELTKCAIREGLTSV
jgi:DNA-binding NarL/FixJ family response regulator